MLGNAFFRQILGPLVLGWAPKHFVLGAQLAPDKKRLVCIPGVLGITSLNNLGRVGTPYFLNFILF